MADNQPIVTEVTATENDVAAVRDEMTTQAAQGATPGTPIDRIPLNPQLVALEAAGTYSKRIANTDRCIRVVELPVKGGVARFHCSRPCVGVGDQRLCPDHDKSFFQPNQSSHGTRGRVTNSDSIPLTKGEADQMATISKSFVASPAATPTAPEAQPTVVAPAARLDAPRQDLKIYLTLEELEGRDLLKVLQERVIEALDGLPCANVRQMKQVVAIQEKVARLARRAKTTEGE